MKIAVDARELVGHATGVGRYLGELLSEWATSPDALAHQWTFYSPQPLVLPSALAAGGRVLPGAGGTAWEQWQLPRTLWRERPDVLFAPGYTAPLVGRTPTVVTIHDVSFAAHPEWFSVREGTRRRTITRLAARRARVILTDTAFSRDEIVRHLAIEPGKVRVIPLGVRRRAREDAARPADEALILFVGSIFVRRHVDALVRAFAAYVAPAVRGSRLEIVGENRAHPRVNLEQLLQAQSAEVARRVAIRAYVDDDTLADLYARASLFVFPSEYEGFGLTPLEAMAAGVPPVVLDTPVAKEVYGPAAHYVRSGAGLEQRLGEILVQLLSNETARAELLRQAPAVLDRYHWRETASATLTALEEAASG